MAKIDISSYKIRVVLNRYLYHRGTAQCPVNVEGTVLFIDSGADDIQSLINKGQLLNVLCDYELRLNDTSVLVRWDNDMKNWYSSGAFAFRAGKISRCKNIWNRPSTVTTSTVPFSNLKPDTGLRLFNNKAAKSKAYTDAYEVTYEYAIEEPSLMDIPDIPDPPRPTKMVMSTIADHSQLEGRVIRGLIERQYHAIERSVWNTTNNAKPAQPVYKCQMIDDEPLF